MDPLSALSVAAAVVQFVDYGSRVVATGIELYKSSTGALAENLELQTASTRLERLSGTVHDSLRRGQQGLQKGPLVECDQALENICKSCNDISKELVSLLVKLKVPEGHAHRKWKGFRQSLNTTRSKGKLEGLSGRLTKLRAELETHVVVSQREHVTSLSVQQDTRFTSLDQDAQNIIKTLLKSREALKEQIDAKFSDLNVSIEQEATTTRSILIDEAEKRQHRRAELHILESLRFDTMTNRHDAIPEAHRRTFEWIFQATEAESKPWSDFCKWAEAGSGIYWITGKAGCGKSTLMRFLIDNIRTREYLEKWAPLGVLETPAFFFWNSGVREQRSQSGLFRSILYEVLHTHPSLIPAVFPEEWQKTLELVKHDIQMTPHAWSTSRLQISFKHLIRQASEPLRFCFFIDGLDEYDGNHDEISEYFSEISNYPFVKFCIASRPLLVFKDFFGTCPGLRLQDLTQEDIRRYIQDKLEENRMMKLLKDGDPKNARLLVRDVIEKAEGVFLWVSLVVDSLLKGLRQRDRIPELMKRLEEFPSDLEHLYGHMLRSIDPVYIEETSKLFQIYQSAARLGIPSMELFYIATIVDLPRILGKPEEDLKIARKEAVDLSELNSKDGFFDVSIYNFESLHEYVDNRMRTRCGGLIECTMPRREGELSYIHRTAKDYLEREDVWNGLVKHTTHINGFDPHLQILMSYVLSAKRVLLTQNYSERMREIIGDRWESIYERAWIIKLLDPQIEFLVLNEFDRVATSLNNKANINDGKALGLSHYWSSLGLPPGWEVDFLCESIRQMHCAYVKTKSLPQNSLPVRDSGMPYFAFSFLAKWSGVFTWKELEMTEILLNLGEDPNKMYEGYTIWQLWVHALHAVRPRGNDPSTMVEIMSGGYRECLRGVIELFLSRGVDLDVCCIDEPGVWERIYSSPNLDSSVSRLKQRLRGHTTTKSEAADVAMTNSSGLGWQYLDGNIDEDIDKDIDEDVDEENDISISSAEDSDQDRFMTTTRSEMVHESSISSSSAEDLNEGNLPLAEEKIVVQEEGTFEERHSLSAVIRYWFNTEDQPHGAEGLLGLIAKLKKEKGVAIDR